jgi:hypothetical protein
MGILALVRDIMGMFEWADSVLRTADISKKSENRLKALVSTEYMPWVAGH